MAETFSGCWHSPAHSREECPSWLEGAASPADALSLRSMVAVCKHDHCTPEEQAVVNAVTEADFIRFLRGDVLDGYKEGAAALEAIDALVAVKSKSEV